jgi:hypothetical protein
MPERTAPTQQAAQLQEAIDTIAQTFDYPPSLSIHHEPTAQAKQTTIELEATGETFELSYQGTDDEAEPELVRLD